MSLLPPHAIDEFQALWRQHYGTELSREDASQRAHQLFTLVRLVVQTPPARVQVSTGSDGSDGEADRELKAGP